jgi:hypothetical protein
MILQSNLKEKVLVRIENPCIGKVGLLKEGIVKIK